MKATIKVSGQGSIIAFARDRQTGRDSSRQEFKDGQEGTIEVTTTGDIVLMMGETDGRNADVVASVAVSEMGSGTQPGGAQGEGEAHEGAEGAQGTGQPKPEGE